MLSLSDPQWGHFSANYTNGNRVAALIARAENGEASHHWYDDLHQELIHQYTVSEAAFPAGPYLVRLAKSRDDARTEVLILLGACHAFSDSEMLGSMPAQIISEWRSSASAALPLILSELEEVQPDASQLLYLLSALAAVSGYPALARSIEQLDYEAE